MWFGCDGPGTEACGESVPARAEDVYAGGDVQVVEDCERPRQRQLHRQLLRREQI